MTDNHTPIPARNSHWPRRRFLQGGTAATAAAFGLLPGVSLAQGVPNQFDGTKFQLAAAEPNPKRGGVLRVAFTSRQPHFDIHQSGTFNNLGTQACMFDNLVRRDPRDGGKTIIPDLAHSWDIAEDGKTYTFILRKDVQFHDGAELTAALRAVQGRGRDRHGGQIHGHVQAFRTATGEFHHVFDRVGLERHRAQEDAGG